LFLIHPHLEALMDVEQHMITEPGHFRSLHRTYLLIASLQWGLGVLHLIALVADWRSRDQQRTTY
jgi:hypothetical protein